MDQNPFTHPIHNAVIDTQEQNRSVLCDADSTDKEQISFVLLSLEKVEFHHHESSLPLRHLAGFVPDLS
jgi:hypothetical protein